jgi:hypothetical protein
MVQIGEVLEAIHHSDATFNRLRAEGSSNRGGWRLWWAGPRRVRAEWAQDKGNSLIVVRDAHWWLVEPNGQGMTNGGDETGIGLGPGAEILHSRWLLSDVVLDVAREEMIAGRASAVLTATPRREVEHSRWWGFPEPFEVGIDLKTGIVLRTPYIEVDHVSFDEEFASELFDEPPDVRGWRPIE